MIILHLSHSSLPDRRVQRSANTANKKGHSCYFAGKNPRPNRIDKSLFKEFYHIPWYSLVKLHPPILWNKLKMIVEEVLSEVQPDIIHAHDVFAGKMCLDLDFPFIYDSHEYWNPVIPLKYNNSLVYDIKKWVSNNYAKELWGKWQIQIVKQAPTVTVSPSIVEELSQYSENVFLLPNFPSISETLDVDYREKESELSCVYIGNDLTRKSRHRDINAIASIFREFEDIKLNVVGDRMLKSSKNIISKGYMNYSNLLNELTRHHLGLIPWNPHPYHKYCLPNKVADYSHAGLKVLASNSLTSVHEMLKEHSISFNNLQEFKDILRTLRESKKELE
jgi:glycosyltransferase involved in cell wall biosynthesis